MSGIWPSELNSNLWPSDGDDDDDSSEEEEEEKEDRNQSVDGGNSNSSTGNLLLIPLATESDKTGAQESQPQEQENQEKQEEKELVPTKKQDEEAKEKSATMPKSLTKKKPSTCKTPPTKKDTPREEQPTDIATTKQASSLKKKRPVKKSKPPTGRSSIGKNTPTKKKPPAKSTSPRKPAPKKKNPTQKQEPKQKKKKIAADNEGARATSDENSLPAFEEHGSLKSSQERTKSKTANAEGAQPSKGQEAPSVSEKIDAEKDQKEPDSTKRQSGEARKKSTSPKAKLKNKPSKPTTKKDTPKEKASAIKQAPAPRKTSQVEKSTLVGGNSSAEKMTPTKKRSPAKLTSSGKMVPSRQKPARKGKQKQDKNKKSATSEDERNQETSNGEKLPASEDHDLLKGSQIEVGRTVVEKTFKKKMFRGTVTSYLQPYYNVVYEDGDEEEMDEEEVLTHMVPTSKDEVNTAGKAAEEEAAQPVEGEGTEKDQKESTADEAVEKEAAHLMEGEGTACVPKKRGTEKVQKESTTDKAAEKEAAEALRGEGTAFMLSAEKDQMESTADKAAEEEQESTVDKAAEEEAAHPLERDGEVLFSKRLGAEKDQKGPLPLSMLLSQVNGNAEPKYHPSLLKKQASKSNHQPIPELTSTTSSFIIENFGSVKSVEIKGMQKKQMKVKIQKGTGKLGFEFERQPNSKDIFIRSIKEKAQSDIIHHLKSRDKIVSLNGVIYTKSRDLNQALANAKEGDQLLFEIERSTQDPAMETDESKTGTEDQGNQMEKQMEEEEEGSVETPDQKLIVQLVGDQGNQKEDKKEEEEEKEDIVESGPEQELVPTKKHDGKAKKESPTMLKSMIKKNPSTYESPATNKDAPTEEEPSNVVSTKQSQSIKKKSLAQKSAPTKVRPSVERITPTKKNSLAKPTPSRKTAPKRKTTTQKQKQKKKKIAADDEGDQATLDESSLPESEEHNSLKSSQERTKNKAANEEGDQPSQRQKAPSASEKIDAENNQKEPTVQSDESKTGSGNQENEKKEQKENQQQEEFPKLQKPTMEADESTTGTEDQENQTEKQIEGEEGSVETPDQKLIMQLDESKPEGGDEGNQKEDQEEVAEEKEDVEESESEQEVRASRADGARQKREAPQSQQSEMYNMKAKRQRREEPGRFKILNNDLETKGSESEEGDSNSESAIESSGLESDIDMDSGESSGFSDRDLDELENEIQVSQRPNKALNTEGIDASVGISLRRSRKRIRQIRRAGASGSKKRHRRTGQRLGPRSLPPEVQSMLGEANTAYILGNHSKAVEILSEVVRQSPQLPDPYHTLGLVYEDMGHERRRALQFYLIAASLTQRARSGDAWKKVAQLAFELGEKKQAIYGYARAVSALPKDLQCAKDHIALLLEDLESKEKKYFAWRDKRQKKEKSGHQGPKEGDSVEAAASAEEIELESSDWEEIEGEDPVEREKRKQKWLQYNLKAQMEMAQRRVIRAMANMVLRHPDQCEVYFDIQRRCQTLSKNHFQEWAKGVLVRTFSRCLLWCMGKRHTPKLVRRETGGQGRTASVTKIKKNGSKELEPGFAAAAWLAGHHLETKQYKKAAAVVTACNNHLAMRRDEEPERVCSFLLPLDLLAKYCQAKIRLYEVGEAEVGVETLMKQNVDVAGEMLLSVGKSYTAIDESDRALKAFRHLQNFDYGKVNPRLEYECGRAHELAGLLDGALTQYKKAADINGSYPLATTSYYSVARRMGSKKAILQALDLLSEGVKKLAEGLAKDPKIQPFNHAMSELGRSKENLAMIWEWANLCRSKSRQKDYLTVALVLVEKVVVKDCGIEHATGRLRIASAISIPWRAQTENIFRGFVSRDWMSPLQEKVARYLDKLPLSMNIIAMMGSYAAWYRGLLAVCRALRAWDRSGDALQLIHRVLRRKRLVQSAQENELRSMASEMVEEVDTGRSDAHRDIMREIQDSPDNTLLWNKLCQVMHLQGTNKLFVSKQCKMIAKKHSDVPYPLLCIAYGLVGKKDSYRSLQYLLYTQQLCPDEPLIPLVIGCTLACLVMHRETINRHHCMFRSVAFLTKYAELRQSHAALVRNTPDDANDGSSHKMVPTPHLEQEVAYNIGRCFHQLSLFHLAAEYYKKSLSIYDFDIKGCTEHIQHVTMETAYNLMKIYEKSGSENLILNLMSKYLSI